MMAMTTRSSISVKARRGVMAALACSGDWRGDPPSVYGKQRGGREQMRAIRPDIVTSLVLLLAAAGCGPARPPYEGKSVAELQAMLKAPLARSRAQGALGLSQHGPAAAPAVGRLTELLDDADGLVR